MHKRVELKETSEALAPGVLILYYDSVVIA